MPPLDVCCKICIILSLLYITTATVYRVVPDDANPTDSDSFTLQYYLNNTNNYCISHNELKFLPGVYYLTDNILIENIKNFSLTGNRTNGMISTVITCTASCGVVVINSSDIILKNIIISECNLLDHYGELLENASLLLQNSWHISILNVQLLRELNGDLSSCTLLVFNILGNSLLSNIKANCLEIYYDEIDDNVANTSNLYINDYQTDYMGTNIYFISIYVYGKVYGAIYDIEIIISNTIFDESPAIDFQCYGFQGFYVVVIQDCICNNATELFDLNLVSINMENCINEYNNSKINQIKFTNCSFISNVFETNELLLDIYIEAHLKQILLLNKLEIFIINCMLHHNRNGKLISIVYSQQGTGFIFYPTVIFINTTIAFTSLKQNSFAIFVERVELFLQKSVIIKHIDADDTSFIIRTKFSSLHFQGYVEMSACTTTAEAAMVAEYAYIDEFTVVNFTANNMAALIMSKKYFGKDPAEILTPMMLLPCIFQYTSRRGNLDTRFQSGNKLNYSIYFINNNIKRFSYYQYAITHCGWEREAAFLHTRASVINEIVIQYVNDSFESGVIQKSICFCDSKDQSEYDCYREDIGPFYPGQTVTFHFITTLLPLLLENLLIRIEDGPETACSTKNRSILTLLPYHVCTKIKYTIQHKSGKECDLYIKGVPQYRLGYSSSPVLAITEYFYVRLLPCPTGFTLLQSDGLCQCDPVLLIHVASVKVCNINDQTILRQPNSWITGITINDSHTYNVSSSCPFDYCSPHSLYLNLLNPDSQCQFNRTGMLCGKCQQGLSAVLGSSQCKRCSNIYLFLTIPIGIAGIALVIILFVFNLTVTDGDINAFLLYVNIVSINAPVFSPQVGFYQIKYALISLANLDLGIEACFYNGMDDYAKTWLQLAFPAYLIMIATTLIMASRYSIRIQRLIARRALPVLATLFLLSYTKVLRTISSVLFFYYEIVNLPSKHTILVWSVDTSSPMFGIKFTFIFVVSLCLFLILLFFNVILIFTRTLSYFKLINRFKPLLDAYQGPYKDKYYFWSGIQLVMRAIFFGLSALDRDTNLMISSILISTAGYIHGALFPFKNKTKNIQELLMMLNLSCIFIFSLYTSSNDIAVTVLIFLAFLQFLYIVINHIRMYLLSIHSVSLAKMKVDTIIKKYFEKSPSPNNDRGNLEMIPEAAYNFEEFREPLIGQDV